MLLAANRARSARLLPMPGRAGRMQLSASCTSQP
jgi:hypothetical protein